MRFAPNAIDLIDVLIDDNSGSRKTDSSANSGQDALASPSDSQHGQFSKEVETALICEPEPVFENQSSSEKECRTVSISESVIEMQQLPATSNEGQSTNDGANCETILTLFL